MDSLVGSRLGEYLIKRRIATGGMASVFEAVHRGSGDHVAIKVLAADLRDRGDPLARILQEGRIVTGLMHEHIVRVIEHGTADENIGFVVMELLEGESLAEVLEREQYLEPQRAVFIARQVCAGLAAAHARDVFHRDVKPGNIVLAEGQRHRDFVKLLDFGIAKLGRDDPARLAATAKGMTLGTPQYMSPEQVTGDAIDARSDIYQLGILLYEMLVGEPPFQHANPVSCMAMHLTTQPRPVRERRPLVPEALDHLILRCLEKVPADRYPDVEALAEGLERLAMRVTLEEGEHSRLEAATAASWTPLLGSPTAPDFTQRLDAQHGRLWPAGMPPELAARRGRLEALEAERQAVALAVAQAQAEVTALSHHIEERLHPLERAISALEAERERLQAAVEEAASDAHRHQKRTQALDLECARIHEEIEARQRTLQAAAEAPTALVDFRGLFRQALTTHLDDLEEVLTRRQEVLEVLQAASEDRLRILRAAADLELQLCELRRSALAVELERVNRVEARRWTLEQQADRLRRIERIAEQERLELGHAFRRAMVDRKG